MTLRTAWIKAFVRTSWLVCLALVLCQAAAAQTITNQPQSSTNNVASTVEFHVGATNATSYQWYFNGTNALVDGTNISGSTNATLTLEDLSTNQDGSYTVVINNSVTSSPPAILMVVPGTVVTFIFTGFTNGGTSNVDVALFDHDKPATVENFIHYITSNAFTNMFIHRDVANFVIQGGAFGVSNRTSTNSPLTGWDISGRFITESNPPYPPFPRQVDNEYGVGPVIHNRFGTIAMALQSGQTNSATSSFFINTADNTLSLDFQDFAVFGRILNGSNTLAYFNSLSNDAGLVLAPAFIDDGTLTTLPGSFLVPVDYFGTNVLGNTNVPGNANLVFIDFSFPNGPPLPDTNPPVVAITSPVATTPLTNALQGTAQDDVALANVFCVLTAQPAADGTYPGFFSSNSPVETNFATGATNWSLKLTPGVYGVSAQSQDGAGNLSSPASATVTNTAIVVIGNGTVTLSNSVATNAVTNISAVGYPFANFNLYNLVATPGSNQLFVGWSGPNLTVFETNLTFLMLNNYIVTATFVSNGLPDSLAFTYPLPGGIVSNTTFDITGTISNVTALPVTVTCDIASGTTSSNLGLFTATVISNNWSVTVSNLPLDSYVVEATATDSASNTTVAIENFTVTTNAPLLLNVIGPGAVTGVTNGEQILVGTSFQATATPSNSGDLFYHWTYGGTTSMDSNFTGKMAVGSTLTAVFVSNTMPNTIAFTAPATNVILSNGAVVISGTISNAPDPPVNLTCQVFYQSNLTAVASAQTNSGTTTWSFLQNGLSAGQYVVQVLAVDQASNSTIVTQSFTATVDTTLPSIAILSPGASNLLTGNNPVGVSGTASDNIVPLASTVAQLKPVPAADTNYPNGGSNIFNYAVGTSNWSVNFGLVPPGVYELQAASLDIAGNYSPISNIFITNTAILINGNGTVTMTKGSTNPAVLTNLVGYPFQPNTNYQVVATPAPGQMFVSWTSGSVVSASPTQNFTVFPGFLLTATFVPTNTEKGISFTYPPANAGLTTNSLTIRGRMTSAFKSAPITCRLVSLTTNFSLGPLQAASGSGTWSLPVTNLPPDNYVVVAESTNAQGVSSTISEKFGIYAFVQAAGTYTGLFISTNSPVSPTNSGSLTFTVARTGVLTGKLTFPAYAPIPIYPILFRNNFFETGYTQFGLTNFHHDTWNGYLNLQLNGTNPVAYGEIYSSNWSAQLNCYRAVTALSTNTTPAAGKYAFTLQPSGLTNGGTTNGYATLNVAKNGILSLAGMLPDNTSFSQSTHVSEEGYWPVCVVPAGDAGKGMLIGWQAFTNGSYSSGQPNWYKAAHVGLYFTNGIGLGSNVTMDFSGTNFVRPDYGSHYTVVFQGGSLATPLTNSLTANKAGQFVVTAGDADKLHLSLSPNGVLTGSLFNPTTRKTLPLKGIFIDSTQGGLGFIPDAHGQTGSFDLTP